MPNDMFRQTGWNPEPSDDDELEETNIWRPEGSEPTPPKSNFTKKTWEAEPTASPVEEDLEYTAVWDGDIDNLSSKVDDEDDITQIHDLDTPNFDERTMPLLWLIAKLPEDQRGTILRILPETVLGRGKKSDVRWQDERLSRRHARFTLEQDLTSSYGRRLFYYIWPLEARKPIEINGQIIRGAYKLSENDEILLGDSLFVVKLLI